MSYNVSPIMNIKHCNTIFILEVSYIKKKNILIRKKKTKA